MKLGVLLCLCHVLSFSLAKDKVFIESNRDSSITRIFTDYQKALLTHAADFPGKWFISDAEYQQLIEYVRKKQPNCIGNDEESFKTE